MNCPRCKRSNLIKGYLINIFFISNKQKKNFFAKGIDNIKAVVCNDCGNIFNIKLEIKKIKEKNDSDVKCPKCKNSNIVEGFLEGIIFILDKENENYINKGIYGLNVKVCKECGILFDFNIKKKDIDEYFKEISTINVDIEEMKGTLEGINFVSDYEKKKWFSRKIQSIQVLIKKNTGKILSIEINPEDLKGYK